MRKNAQTAGKKRIKHNGYENEIIKHKIINFSINIPVL